MAAETIDEAIAQAQKILGKDANIPKPKVDFSKLDADAGEAFQGIDAAREDLEAKILEMENILSAYKNGNKQAGALYEKEDFDLDPKNKDDAKKIKQAQKVFSDLFSSQGTEIDKQMKALDELDKHIIQIGKYKGPPK